MFSMEPFPGARGIPQSTGGRKLIVYNSLISSTKAKSATEVKIHIAQTTHPFYPSRSLSGTMHAEFSDPMIFTCNILSKKMCTSLPAYKNELK